MRQVEPGVFRILRPKLVSDKFNYFLANTPLAFSLIPIH